MMSVHTKALSEEACLLSPVHSAGAGGVSETGGVWEREGGYCGADGG